MRKIIWIGGPLPAGMDREGYNNIAASLAKAINGEIVQFGEDNRAIIGDEEAEKRYNELQTQKAEKESKKAGPVGGTPEQGKKIEELQNQGYKWNKEKSAAAAGVILEKREDIWFFGLGGEIMHNPDKFKEGIVLRGILFGRE